MSQAVVFAASTMALYAAHHVGDYWVQTDHQARHKGQAGADGVLNCLLHVISYLMTQLTFLALLVWAVDLDLSVLGTVVALAVSGLTHYTADRREHGLMFWLIRQLEPVTGKASFMALGRPRGLIHVQDAHRPYDGGDGHHVLDNPCLGTGAWALDQSWHIFWGVFVSAIILSVL